MKNTLIVIFVIVLTILAVVLYKGVKSVPDKNIFVCEPEQRNVDACIQIYEPVCAEVNVQCIKAPCPPTKETFSNACLACKNSLISKYTEGECTEK